MLPNEVILQAAYRCRDVYAQKPNWLVDNSIDGYCIIAIQGTNQTMDWVTNLKFLFRKADTHRGFKENALSVMQNLFIRDSIDWGRRIVLCGHSLGGATATVMADLLLVANRDVSIVTLGSPRPGGRNLAKRLVAVKHYRYVHGDDVVPKSPPWFTGYVHMCAAVPLTDARPTSFDCVADHDWRSYCEALTLALATE